MARKSLKDALNFAIDDMPKDSMQTARSIINRQVVQPEKIDVEPENIEREVNEKVNLDINLNENKETESKYNQEPTGHENNKIIPLANELQEKPALKSEILIVEKPAKFRDLHKNTAYLVRKDIEEKINQLAKKGGKGWKTRFVNEALRAQLILYGIVLDEI